MDEIRNVAKAYYDGADEAKRKLVDQLFQTLDEDGDGKVSLSEYKKLVKPFFSRDDIFEELDENGDKTLDFDEVLALYYMDKISIPKCSLCDVLLTGSYFSCLRCQTKDSYYLCCSCYRGRQFMHQHSSEEFMDNRAMLMLLDRLLKNAQINVDQQNTNTNRQDGANQSAGQSRSQKIRDLLQGIDHGLGIANTVLEIGKVAISVGLFVFL